MRTFSFTFCIALCFITVGNLCLAQVRSISSNSNTLIATTPDSRGWTDPALNHNRLLRDQLGDGTFIVIGNFKVKGSPYLFGDKHNSDLFSKSEKAYNIDLRYNTYNQEVEFYSTSNATALVKTVGELDSFIIKKDVANSITSDIKFVYGPLIGSTEKIYFQLVESGPQYSLYKRYTSELGYVSENYIQSELRQFDMLSDYYYHDVATNTLKKLKKNTSSINKEFKSIKDVSSIVTSDSYSVNQEETLKNAIRALNESKKAF